MDKSSRFSAIAVNKRLAKWMRKSRNYSASLMTRRSRPWLRIATSSNVSRPSCSSTRLLMAQHFTSLLGWKRLPFRAPGSPPLQNQKRRRQSHPNNLSDSRLIEHIMDLNKFTEKSQGALMEAQAIATRNQHQAVDVEHLFLAL